MTNNMLAIFNTKLKGGASIVATGPCATAHLCKSTEPVVNFGTAGYPHMNIYVWGGALDPLTGADAPRETATYYK